MTGQLRRAVVQRPRQRRVTPKPRVAQRMAGLRYARLLSHPEGVLLFPPARLVPRISLIELYAVLSANTAELLLKRLLPMIFFLIRNGSEVSRQRKHNRIAVELHPFGVQKGCAVFGNPECAARLWALELNRFAVTTCSAHRTHFKPLAPRSPVTSPESPLSTPRPRCRNRRRITHGAKRDVPRFPFGRPRCFANVKQFAQKKVRTFSPAADF